MALLRRAFQPTVRLLATRQVTQYTEFAELRTTADLEEVIHQASARDITKSRTEENILEDHKKVIQGCRKIAKTLTRDEFLAFAEKFEATKAEKKDPIKAIHKADRYEDFPQAVRDLAEGRDKCMPDPHPYLERRLRSIAEGTWVWPIQRHTGPVNEFQQPMKTNDHWLDKIKNGNWEYWEELTYILPKMGRDRAVFNATYLEVLFDGMLTCKQKNETEEGHLPAQMLDFMYDLRFCMEEFGEKPTERMWNQVLMACVKIGEWRLAYCVEDAMKDMKFKPDIPTLKKIDEIAQTAWNKGYLLPPHMQGKDINDCFKVETTGGVGAYVPLPRGESWGFALWRVYDQMKAEGTFKPPNGMTPTK